MNTQSSLHTLRGEIDELNRLSWEKRIHHSHEAMKLAEEALVKAQAISYNKGTAKALRTKGFCQIRIGEFNEAHQSLKKAHKLFESLDDKKGLATVYEYFGIINRNRGDLGSSLKWIDRALELSQETEFTEHEITNHYQKGVTLRSLGNYDQAIESIDLSLQLARKHGNTLMIGYDLNIMGSLFYKTSKYPQALEYYQEAHELRQESGDLIGAAGSLNNIGSAYLKIGNLEEASNHCKQSLEISQQIGDIKGEANSMFLLAEINMSLNKTEKAFHFIQKAEQLRKHIGDRRGQVEAILYSINIRKQTSVQDEIEELIESLSECMSIVKDITARDLISQVHKTYFECYRLDGNHKSALEHLEAHYQLDKELKQHAVSQKIRNLEISHEVEESKKEAEIFKLRNVELSNLYSESQRQKEEIEQQKKNIEKTLNDLKATQAQLIQSEKMASLGELTAGIAHEIKNPLNFVNNFSDVNAELIDELVEELQNGQIEEAIELARDIKSNEEKIKHHGSRADSIVKGMLMHSRNSSGKKEATDINALADEYLRLAYHGLRAKDKSFNAAMHTHFDESIGRVKVVPQDIGRVLLNLITNAFHAVKERQNKGLEGFAPEVSVSTQKIFSLAGNPGKERIQIQVKDNGNGIPDEVKDKIYQPFFTTKPTGQGTGLGLSISYDIITKGHQGEISVESEEGKGTIFTILLN